jgi:hypothetical protein
VIGKHTAVLGIYCSPPAAKRAVEALIAAGFAIGDISVLLADVSGGTARELSGVALFDAPPVGRAKGRATLLSVHCDTADQTCRAIDLLKGAGAEDIAEAGIDVSPMEGDEPLDA